MLSQNQIWYLFVCLELVRSGLLSHEDEDVVPLKVSFSSQFSLTTITSDLLILDKFKFKCETLSFLFCVFVFLGNCFVSTSIVKSVIKKI